MPTTLNAPRTRLTAAQRSEQLLDVAEELFMAKGFDQTSVEDIARASGVTRPIVYQHHGSKEGVYVACLGRARRRLVDDYTEALDGLDSPIELLRAAAEVWFATVERDPERWVLLFGTSLPMADALGRDAREAQAMNTEYYRLAFEGWVRPGISPDHTSAAAQMVAGMGSQLAQWWLANPHITREEIVAFYVEFCWNGIGPLLAGGGS